MIRMVRRSTRPGGAGRHRVPAAIAFLLSMTAFLVTGDRVASAQEPATTVEQTDVAAGAAALPQAADGPVLPRSMRPYYHVFAAYGVAWILILLYVVSVGRRLRRLEREVQGMNG